jgi:PAS domain S-box-containing protein
MKFISIRSKVLALSVFTIIASSLLLIFFLNIKLRKKLTAELHNKGIFIAQRIAETSVDLILTRKILSLKLLLHDFRQSEENLVYIFILDAKKEVVAHTFPAGFPAQLLNISDVDTKRNYGIRHLRTNKESVYEIILPILDGEAGNLHLGMSEEPIIAGVREIIRDVLLINLLILIGAGSIAFGFALFISGPIFHLSKAAAEVGLGNLDHKVRINTRDELGHLGNIFNKMTDDLRRTTLSFKNLVETALDAIITFDQKGKIILWNNAAQKIFGYDEQEILHQPIAGLMSKTQIKENLMAGNNNLGQWGNSLLGKTREIVAQRKDQEEFPLELSLTSWNSGGQVFYTCLARDITKRRKSEKEIRELSQKIISVQEEERFSIANYLHDHFGQCLSAMKITLSSFKNRCDQGKKVDPGEFEKISKNIDGLIQDMRQLSHLLSPLGIKFFGLEASVRNLVESFSSVGSPFIKVRFTNIDDNLSDEKKLNIYRIIQESLTNIIKHADAGRVLIIGKKAPGKIIFRIMDDGKGMSRPLIKVKPDNGHLISREHGLGLLIMRERAALLGGELTIRRHNRSGMEVKVEIPG